MKIFIIILLLINLVSYSQDSTLFVGNSMIKYDKNHTLEILEKILENQSKKHYFTDKASDGTSLYKHLTVLPTHKKFGRNNYSYSTDQIEKAETPAYIIKNKFDNILFQETPMTVVNDAFFHKKTITAFTKLDSLAVLSGAQVFWLEPYASIYYHLNKNPKVNIDSVYQISHLNFEKLKKIDSNLINIPIAYITKEFKKKYPNQKLNIGGSHPNDEMQFILACCIYYSIYNGLPEEIPYLGLFRKEIKEKALKEYTYLLYKEYLNKY